MTAKAEFENFVAEQISAFGKITLKRMFGALAFYHQGLIIGMAIDDALYLKGDEQSKPKYESENLPQFTYGHKGGKQIAMSYWRAPERCLDTALHRSHELDQATNGLPRLTLLCWPAVQPCPREPQPTWMANQQSRKCLQRPRQLAPSLQVP